MLHLEISKASTSHTADSVGTHQLALSHEQPDLLRSGMENASRVQEFAELSFAPVSFANRKSQLFQSVASQYGIGAALRRQADLKVVEQFHRLPGLKSSFLGIEMELGDNMDIQFHDWMGDHLPQNNRFDCDLHATMEHHLGME